MSKNIVLIGMPGAGKTTIGKKLREKLNRRFVDTDDFIVKESGKTIPELFAVSEDHFRDFESAAVTTLSREDSLIIATGGGVIKRRENMDELKKNGIIVFIDRPLADIAADVELSSRPLLQDGLGKLYALYDQRYELYRSYSDFRVLNNHGVEEAVCKIIEKCASD